MLDISEATRIIDEHFREVTPDQFIENVKRFCPSFLEQAGGWPSALNATARDAVDDLAAAFETSQPLRVFLSYSAASGSKPYPKSSRRLPEIIADICVSHGIAVFDPPKWISPSAISPQPAEMYEFIRQLVFKSDLLVAVVDDPSLGVGMELQMAAGVSIPVVLVTRDEGRLQSVMKDARLPLRLDTLAGSSVFYGNAAAFRRGLHGTLTSLKPLLAKRRQMILALLTEQRGWMSSSRPVMAATFEPPGEHYVWSLVSEMMLKMLEGPFASIASTASHEAPARPAARRHRSGPPHARKTPKRP